MVAGSEAVEPFAPRVRFDRFATDSRRQDRDATMELRYDDSVLHGSGPVGVQGSSVLDPSGAEIGVHTVFIVSSDTEIVTATTIDDRPANSFGTD